MLRVILAGSMAATALIGSSSPTFAQAPSAAHEEICKAIFANYKSTIETMARSGNRAGIQSIFSKGGCPDATINIARASEKSNERIGFECHWTLNPFHIECKALSAAAHITGAQKIP
jgi:hypothetical protein